MARNSEQTAGDKAWRTLLRGVPPQMKIIIPWTGRSSWRGVVYDLNYRQTHLHVEQEVGEP